MTAADVFASCNKVFDLLLRHPAKDDELSEFSFGAHLGHEPVGVLTSVDLSGEPADAYRELLSIVWAATHWGRAGNPEEITGLARRFILEMAVDAGPGRTEIKKRFALLFHEQLGANRVPWRVIARVPARGPAGTYNFSIGGLKFLGLPPEQHAVLKRRVRRAIAREFADQLDDLVGHFSSLRGRDLICTVDVEAADKDRAFLVAQELITDRLDLLAGISALCRKPSKRETDPRRWGGPRIAFPLKGRTATVPRFPPSPDEVDLTELYERRNHPTVRKLLRLIDKRTRTDGERRLLGTLRWLGRSHRAPNEETAYLLAVIAFETILKGNKEGKEGGIGQGLSLRYAQLRGRTRSVRRKLLASVGPLYGKRSAIVHAREGSVNFAELSALWSVVNVTTFAFLERRFHRLSNAQINTWFEDQNL